VQSLYLNAAGDKVITGTFDGMVKIWEIATGKCLLSMQGDSSNIDAIEVMYEEGRIISHSSCAIE